MYTVKTAFNANTVIDMPISLIIKWGLPITHSGAYLSAQVSLAFGSLIYV